MPYYFFLGDYIFGGYGSNENVYWIYMANKRMYNELGIERVSFLKSLP